MDDLLWLTTHYSVRIAVENRTMGTGGDWVSLTAIVVIENSDTKLTARGYKSGEKDLWDELRMYAVLDALANLRRRVEAME